MPVHMNAHRVASQRDRYRRGGVGHHAGRALTERNAEVRMCRHRVSHPPKLRLEESLPSLPVELVVRHVVVRRKIGRHLEDPPPDGVRALVDFLEQIEKLSDSCAHLLGVLTRLLRSRRTAEASPSWPQAPPASRSPGCPGGAEAARWRIPRHLPRQPR